ncbi:Probable RNA-directed DNA polymerase from transposon X-element [Eumeta japonica]|uniref:Probable RNA-directed DNA polymerase from transposon X-element n=1 Tax=Eumeta variegata TaxID=151549 RepID=A0A4C1X001_EUMVA|nr:Probable RNA-directed DNA polymerase from transposon X-element [Eumeta japonica]
MIAKNILSLAPPTPTSLSSDILFLPMAVNALVVRQRFITQEARIGYTYGREQRYFQKEKKPPKEPSSYRPLCMLDIADKIYERIIHQRKEAAVESLLTDNQYGFRKGRSTLDANNLVVNTATEAIVETKWKGGTKKYCLMVTLDIRNAFNSANLECIMQALREKNVPEYLCKIVAIATLQTES